MASKFEPKAIDDEDLLYFIEEVINSAVNMVSVGYYPNDDMVSVCSLCDDVDGHLEGCPISAFNKIVKLSAEDSDAKKKDHGKKTDSSQGR